MSYQNIFKRYEVKYLLPEKSKKKLLELMNGRMTRDAWGKSTICNLYYDTPDYLLIRRSVERPVYKEKLRVRSYGRATPDSDVFVELKKKYKHVVYKRRIPMKARDAEEYLSGKSHPKDSQIVRELDYCLSFYDSLAPRVFISYEREAFFDKEDHDFRITFDSNIIWRESELSLCSEPYGTPLLEEGYSLMEVKIATAMPLWLTQFLTEEKIYKTRFSKYGKAYQMILEKEMNKNV